MCVFHKSIALAHPGNTDLNRGHVERSSGEYHYHHGYVAHGHYDMDNDGDIDCPYDFVDKTGENRVLNNTEDIPSNVYAETVLQKDSNNSIHIIVVCLILVVLPIGLYIFHIWRQIKKHPTSIQPTLTTIKLIQPKIDSNLISSDASNTSAQNAPSSKIKSESLPHDIIPSDELSYSNTLTLLSSSQISFINVRLQHFNLSYDDVAFAFKNHYDIQYSGSELFEIYQLSLMEQKYSTFPTIETILPNEQIAQNAHDSAYLYIAKNIVTYLQKYHVSNIAIYYACKILDGQYEFNIPSVFSIEDLQIVTDIILALNACQNSTYYHLYKDWFKNILLFGDMHWQ